jgi:hypothetical protein
VNGEVRKGGAITLTVCFTNVHSPSPLHRTSHVMLLLCRSFHTVIDFTWPGRLVCLFFCVLGIALYAIPVGTLFDSFGAVLGMDGDEEDQEDEEQ